MLDYSNINIMFVEHYCMKRLFNIGLIGISCFLQTGSANALAITNVEDTSITKPQVTLVEQLLEGESEEVVVTGLCRAGFQKENPIAIQAISSKAIDRTIASNIMDQLSLHSPGVSVLKTGPNISKPFIRGLGYHRVLTLYDGIRQEGQQWGDEHGIEIDEYSVGRVEILKGPASLMYGSDALAGVFRLCYPNVPVQEGTLRGNVLSGFQSNNQLWGGYANVAGNKRTMELEYIRHPENSWQLSKPL